MSAAGEEPSTAAAPSAATAAAEEEGVRVGGSLLWGGSRSNQSGGWGGGGGSGGASGRPKDQQLAALQQQIRELEATRDRLAEELVAAATEAAAGQAAQAAARRAAAEVTDLQVRLAGLWGEEAATGHARSSRGSSHPAMTRPRHVLDQAAAPPINHIPWPAALQERLAAALELLGEKAELLEEAMTDMDEMRVSEEKREGDVAGWEGRREG